MSISRGLTRAIGLADAVALGDLSQTVTVSTNDEVRDLVTALSQMTFNLRATAAMADSIAEGDLSVQVVPLSAKDALGQAFLGMTEICAQQPSWPTLLPTGISRS